MAKLVNLVEADGFAMVQKATTLNGTAMTMVIVQSVGQMAAGFQSGIPLFFLHLHR